MNNDTNEIHPIREIKLDKNIRIWYNLFRNISKHLGRRKIEGGGFL